MRLHNEKTISLILCTFLLCSCSQDNVNFTETTSAGAAVTEETAITESSPPETTSVSEMTVNEAEEAVNDDFYSHDERVQGYMEQLTKLESFNETLPQAACCLICDLDSNGTPEVVIQAAAHISVSAVFSVDDDGAFMADPAGGTAFTDADTWRSYDGEIPQGFILDGKDQYFASCLIGGTAGYGGIIKLELNGRKLSSEYVGEYSYSSTMGFEYSGFDNEEQYNEYIRSYFQKLEPQWKLLPHKELIDIKEKTPNHISSLLEKYYNDRDDIAEFENFLDDDLEYDIAFKPISERTEYFDGREDYTKNYAYDHAGSLLENKYGSKLTYTYYPSGNVKTKNYTDGETYTYDEDGNLLSPAPDELTYDEMGRVKTRTDFVRDFVNGGYRINSITEYFYNGDTDEVVKKIRTYNQNTTETYLYENGLEVSFEWHDPDGGYISKKTILKDHTPDGLISKMEYFDGEGNLSRTITYEYDSENRLIREESITTQFYWDESDRCNDYIDSYTYNEDGKLLLNVFEALTYGDTHKYEYIYDEDGNLTEMINTNDHDNEMVGYSKGSFVTRYSYEFDFAGNVIRSAEKYEDEWVTVTEYRAIKVIRPKEQ